MNVVSLQKPEQQQDLIIAFDDFWMMYPRRVAKKDARKAWEKIPRSEHQTIVTALFEWRRIWLDRNELEFVPYPATWLNGERWEDEFPQGHQPYKDRPKAQVEQKVETPRTAMPAHVREFLLKFRGPA